MIGQCLSNKNESATMSKSKKNLDLNSSHQKPKKFQDSPSHQILRHMHEALNIYTVCL